MGDEKVIQAGMFNNRSTGNERRQLLQSILRCEDEEQEDEDEAPDDEVINQMIARSEDEFEKFQQMDIQRRREDAALGADRKPRLMEENELPTFMLEEDDDIEEEVPEEILGRGNRSKKDTNYDDQMSEREWLKAIGAEEEEGGDDYDDDEDTTPTKKKRGGGKKRRKGYDSDEDEGFDGRKRKKKISFKKLQKKMRKLMEIVIRYKDEDGRVLSEPFMKLPTRKELPDYYEVIRRPVDISKIQVKIDDGKFDDIDTLEKDFTLLCENAQKYNQEGSIIHEDSVVLQSVFTNARELCSEMDIDMSINNDELDTENINIVNVLVKPQNISATTDNT